VTTESELLEAAWVIIANAGWDAFSGNVDGEKSPGWHDAAIRWRDKYNAYIGNNKGEMTMLDLEKVGMEEAIGIAIGAASLCWENPSGAGEFDSTQASKIVDELLEKIRSEVRWTVTDGDVLVIAKKSYDSLCEDSKKLTALEAAGVDNWEGYDNAMDILREN
jgi:hypothetical protein